MSWGDGGGDGDRGPWKPGHVGPWGQGAGGSRQLDTNDWLRIAREWVARHGGRGTGPGGIGLPGWLVLVAIGVGLWLLTGFYTVGPNQVGLNLIFGRYTGKTSPGLNYNWPFPVGSVDKLNVTDRNAFNVGFVTRPDFSRPDATSVVDVPQESLMLTGDENIADVKFVVFWQIDPSHPEYYAFNVANQRPPNF